LITSEAFVLAKMLPLVPVILNEYFPDSSFLAVARVNTELPEVFTDGGLNTAVTPSGNPLTLRATVPLKVSTGLTVTV